MWCKLTKENIKHFHIGEKFNSNMLRDFVETNRFDEATLSSPIDYAKMLKEGRFPDGRSRHEQNSPPYIDHARIFKSTETGVMCLTYQPYKEAVESRSNVEQWANDNGLKVEIYEAKYSWYYPAETLLIIVHLPDTEIPLSNM